MLLRGFGLGRRLDGIGQSSAAAEGDQLLLAVLESVAGVSVVHLFAGQQLLQSFDLFLYREPRMGRAAGDGRTVGARCKQGY